MLTNVGERLEAAPLSRMAQLTIMFILASFAIRLVCAATLPLSGDEALYWSYSKHLDWGFVDHPVVNPFLIRVGTSLFGDTPIGVRIMPLVLSLPASWAVWRAGSLLFAYFNADAGPTAALVFNLTIAVSIGSFIATSDASVIVASAFALYFLAKVETTEQGVWWVGAGISIGLGMLSKYTTVFLAAGIVLWILITPQRRKWLLNPFSFAGGLIAIAFFLPVLAWNWKHEWISFVYQAGRTNSHGLSLRYFDDYIASQAAYLTPPVFILGILACTKAPALLRYPASTRTLIVSLISPTLLYFAWHSLHERVEGNWPEVMYPAFTMAVTMAIISAKAGSSHGRWVRWPRRLLLPFGIGLAAIIYCQALFDILPLGRKDPVSRELAYGWHEIAEDIDNVARENDIERLITSDYTTNGWLRFYLSSSVPVTQINERLRWANEPAPPENAFGRPMLYVCRDNCQFLDDVQKGFGKFTYLEKITRTRNSKFIETYSIYLVANPKSDPYSLIKKPFVKGQP